ncbi:MAG: folate family ECF transporter S component [Ligilactobacillus agilis]|nr:folate family ECF transporter S component [Ligilactobacillus agilis]
MNIVSLHGPKFDTKKMTLAAMLTALQVILSKISVGDPAVLKVGLDFIGVALLGYFLGPWIGMCAMVISDLVANLLLNSGVMFFPGFTFSAGVAGIIAGMLLYNQKVSWQRIFIYVFIQIGVTKAFFTTLWLYMMGMSSGNSGRTFMALLSLRLPTEVISWPIEALILLGLFKAIQRIGIDK